MERNNLLAWVAGFTALVMVVALPVSCSVHSTNKLAEAIEKGADPIKARCAFNGSGSNGTTLVCAMAAMKGESK